MHCLQGHAVNYARISTTDITVLQCMVIIDMMNLSAEDVILDSAVLSIRHILNINSRNILRLLVVIQNRLYFK